MKADQVKRLRELETENSRLLATRGAQGADQATERGRLWLDDGSCIRLRPEHRDHVWSYDFVEDRSSAPNPVVKQCQLDLKEDIAGINPGPLSPAPKVADWTTAAIVDYRRIKITMPSGTNRWLSNRVSSGSS